jgi:DNA ligase (NAD+)
MYNSKQIKELQESTSRLHKKINSIEANDIESLREILRYHEYRYYILNDPLLADFEYDQLFKTLESWNLNIRTH